MADTHVGRVAGSDPPSTFVIIGQNRQAAFQEANADRDYSDVNKLLVENTDLTRSVHHLTNQVHELLFANKTPAPPTSSS